jgi:hypothetical protein
MASANAADRTRVSASPYSDRLRLTNHAATASDSTTSKPATYAPPLVSILRKAPTTSSTASETTGTGLNLKRCSDSSRCSSVGNHDA